MGHDVVTDYRAARSRIGVVPQELVFDPFFSVRETLRFQSGYFGLRRNDDWIDEVMANLDLAAKADANMRTLSGGMKRRVLVAQALVHRPPVIVLDEPTAGVDVELRQGLWAFIRRLNREGHTIVLTTHYLEEAQQLCGRIGMLKGGRLIALDRTQALLQRLADVQVRLRLRGDVPPALRAQAIEQGDGRLKLRVAAAADVEGVLAACREAGAGLDEVEVGHADLEDVFLQLMAGDRQRVAA
jgi:ABC-2 type transport system ATP-binding protein